MKSRFLPSLTAAGLALGLLIPLLPAGCSDPVQPTPRTAIYSSVFDGKLPDAMCMYGGMVPWIVIGTIGQNRGPSDPVLPIDNGGSYMGQSVNIDCTVTPSGAGLQVNAQAELQGAGTVSISGLFATAPTDGSAIPAQMNVSAVFEKDESGQFTAQNNCVMTFPRPEMGIAPGRIWGQLDCADVQNKSQMRDCQGTAELRFENCAQ